MPITLLDILLLVVMLISGLLAMIRGFMREILSMGGWGVGGLATLYAYARVLPIAKGYFSSDMVAAGVTVGGVFLLTLLIVSIITVRISDMVLDSRIGALDRTLGFLFGLGRGLVIVVVAFVFFAWLVPPGKQPEGVRNAKSRVVLENTGEWLQALLPQDMDNYLSQLLKKKKGDEQEPPPDAPPGQRSGLGVPLGAPLGSAEVTGSVRNPAGYQRADRTDMRQLS